MVVRDCTFENTEAGIRMKANRGSGGLVEDCTYDHLKMKKVKSPILISSYYPERNAPKQAELDPAKPIEATTPIWKNIRISNVTSEGSPSAGKIIGLAEMPVQDITFTNVSISATKGLSIWNAKGIHFVDSKITVSGGNVLDLQNATDVTGLSK